MGQPANDLKPASMKWWRRRIPIHTSAQHLANIQQNPWQVAVLAEVIRIPAKGRAVSIKRATRVVKQSSAYATRFEEGRDVHERLRVIVFAT